MKKATNQDEAYIDTEIGLATSDWLIIWQTTNTATVTPATTTTTTWDRIPAKTKLFIFCFVYIFSIMSILSEMTFF